MAIINNNLGVNGAVLVGTSADDFFSDASSGTTTILVGGLGNDYYVIDGTADVALEYNGKAEGIDTVGIFTTGVNGYVLSDNVENLILGGTVTAGIYSGNAGDNIINASGITVAVTLYGLAGNDTLMSSTTGNVADTLDGGAGIDTMTGGNGGDTYYVDNAGDKIVELSTDTGTDLVRAYVSYTLPAEVEGLYLQAGYAAAITGTGNALNNTMGGNEFNNTLIGGDGNDTINATLATNGSSAGGNDTLDGGNGNDTLTGGTGNDKLLGGAGNDVLNSGNGDNTLDGGTGEDALTAGSGNDTLMGGAGNDYLDGGAGNDKLDGGDGNDWLKDTSATGNGTLFGGGGNDLLVAYGTKGTTFDGGAGNDILVLLGANGSDAGFTSSVSMQGGAGDDTFYLQAAPSAINVKILDAGGNDTVRLVGSAGNILVGPDTWVIPPAAMPTIPTAPSPSVGLVSPGTELISYTLAAGIENLFADTAATAKYLVGNDLDNNIRGTNAAVGDVLIGGKGNDKLDGGTGADDMVGGAGNDLYLVDNANDTVFEDPAATGGIDTVWAWTGYKLEAGVENLTFFGGTTAMNGAGNDLANIIVGNDGINVLDGGKGNDAINGKAGNDTLYGGAGNDTLDGGTGVDNLYGGDGNDVYWVDSQSDVVRDIDDTFSGASGNDLVRSTANQYALANGNHVENLTLEDLNTVSNGQGNDMANVIKGNKYDNYLSDGSFDYVGGSFIWTPDSAKDTLDGGAGNDTFFSTVNTYIDNIVDSAGTSDTLVLFVANAANSGLKTVANKVNLTLGVANAGTTPGLNLSGIENLYLDDWNQVHVATGTFTGFNIMGSAVANTLIGSNLDDILDGGAGNDVLYDYGGDNILRGGAGNDSLYGDSVGTTFHLDGGLGDDWYNIGFNTTVNITGDAGGIDRITAADMAVDLTAAQFGGTTGGAGVIEKVALDITAAVLAPLAVTGTIAANELQLASHVAGAAAVITLAGGKGDDLYIIGIVGQSNTTPFNLNRVTISELASEGTDKVLSYVNNYVLQANVENLELGVLTNGAFVLAGTGNGLANNIKGNDGNNTLDGGSGSTGTDTLIGGKGDDVYIVHTSTDIVTELLNEGTDREVFSSTGGNFTLAANVEHGYLWDYPAGVATFTGAGLTGNLLDNQLYGNQVANTLDGGAGNDILYGSVSIAGAVSEDSAVDTLKGGAGDDAYYVFNGDIVTELAAGGIDIVYLGGNNPSYTLANEVENLTVQNTSVTSVTGNALANIIDGSGGAAGGITIDGLAGNDTLYGTAGADTMYGGTGADTMIGGNGADTYYVGNAGDVVLDTGASGTDIIFIYGSSVTSHDTESAGLRAFSLASNGWGVENLYFQNNAAGSQVWLEGNELNNQISFDSTTSSGFLQGGGGDDVLTIVSGTASNILDGGAGIDVLTGGNGNDTLIGGMGADSLTGGAGADTFVFDSPVNILNNDTIADFVQGTDKIQLDSGVFTSLTAPTLVGGSAPLNEFLSGAGVTAAVDANDYIIFNTTTGALYYDADGSGGAFTATQFATITAVPLLAATDFIVA